MKSLTKAAAVFKFGSQAFRGLSTSAKRQTKSTVDAREVESFSKTSHDWWDLNGGRKLLHSMNPLRIKFVQDGLESSGSLKVTNPGLPLKGVKLLDVGCGGGILSEPLARLGAEVTGLDASRELVNLAREHAATDERVSSKLRYVDASVEDFAREHKESFDAVVASEIIEHVNDQDLFLKSCVEALKPNGSIFVSTFSRNTISWLGGIIAMEYVFNMIPKGTHDWNKFISPDETTNLLNKYNCETKLVRGLVCNPLNSQWHWISSTKMSYALHAVKKSTLS